jgi:hypothetical protein
MIAIAIDLILNNSLFQTCLAVLGGFLALWGYGHVKRKEGEAEANANNKAQILEENQHVRGKEDDIRQKQMDAANKRPISNLDAADELRKGL